MPSVRLNPVYGRAHQNAAMKALAQGLRCHDVDIVDGPADVSVWWGNPRDDLSPVNLLLEAGYINGESGDYVSDRLRFVSTSWNKLHGRSDGFTRDMPGDRWKKIGVPLKPWRLSDGYVLVCDQHPGDSVAPRSKDWWRVVCEWYDDDYSVLYRPHPLVSNSPLAPLRDVLDDARYCFTWNSTAGIESVIAGVPTWTLERGSMAWAVSAHDVSEGPKLLSREQWAYNLAYRQWTHDELASGEMWDNIWPADFDIT